MQALRLIPFLLSPIYFLIVALPFFSYSFFTDSFDSEKYLILLVIIRDFSAQDSIGSRSTSTILDPRIAIVQ